MFSVLFSILITRLIGGYLGAIVGLVSSDKSTKTYCCKIFKTLAKIVACKPNERKTEFEGHFHAPHHGTPQIREDTVSQKMLAAYNDVILTLSPLTKAALIELGD